MTIFEAWEDEEGITFSTKANIIGYKKIGLLSEKAKFLYQIEASSYKEAMELHHQKMGWEPYKQMK